MVVEEKKHTVSSQSCIIRWKKDKRKKNSGISSFTHSHILFDFLTHDTYNIIIIIRNKTRERKRERERALSP